MKKISQMSKLEKWWKAIDVNEYYTKRRIAREENNTCVFCEGTVEWPTCKDCGKSQTDPNAFTPV